MSEIAIFHQLTQYSSILRFCSVTVAKCNFAHKRQQVKQNALPFRSERKGIIPMAAPGEMIPLLLVVHCCALVFLALCIGSVDCDRAALAIGGDHDMGRENNLPAFFGCYMERAVVSLFS